MNYVVYGGTFDCIHLYCLHSTKNHQVRSNLKYNNILVLSNMIVIYTGTKCRYINSSPITVIYSVCYMYDQSPKNIAFMRWTCCTDLLSLINIVGSVCDIDNQSPMHHSINSVFFKPTNNDFHWWLKI